jgi:hypothetical protein
MSKKRKRPQRWAKQWFVIELYKPIGWLRRRRFYVFATTHSTAQRKFMALHPRADVMLISNICG